MYVPMHVCLHSIMNRKLKFGVHVHAHGVIVKRWTCVGSTLCLARFEEKKLRAGQNAFELNLSRLKIGTIARQAHTHSGCLLH